MTTGLAEARYRQLVELSLDGILIQLGGHIVFANSAAHRLLGDPATGSEAVDGIIGRPIDDFLDPPYLTIVRDELIEPGSTRTPYVERRLRRMDGTPIDVEVSAVPFVFEDRAAVQLVIRDIHERVEARRAARQVDTQLQILADQMPFVMWTSDVNARVLTVIGDPASPFGARAKAAMARGGALLLEDANPPLRQVVEDYIDGDHAALEVQLGGRAYAVRLEPLRDEGHVTTGWIGVAFDITPWLRMQELMRDARRLDEVGQLAGGVAHQINNVLAIISLNGELLQNERNASERATLRARQIVVATERAAEITRNLLAFAMRDVHRPRILSLNDLARDLAQTVGRSAPLNVTTELRLAPELPMVMADERQLFRALMNLCMNAVDAMPDGGRLTLETQLLQAAPLRTGVPPERVCLLVKDTGIGMNDEIRERVFEPFFSTGAGPRHVGLGMSMAQGVVKQHRGEIALQSAPGMGTVVRVELPIAPIVVPASSEATSTRQALADTSGRPMALIVDDEPMIRNLLGRMVGRAGYGSVEASDGEEALALFRASPDQFAFILLDVQMPGMSGIEVLGHLIRIDADARVVLCTGYPRNELDDKVFALGMVEHLGKPYSKETLRETIARVTGRVRT